MNCRQEVGRDILSAQEENMVFQSSSVMEGNKPQVWPCQRVDLNSDARRWDEKIGISKILCIWSAILPQDNSRIQSKVQCRETQ